MRYYKTAHTTNRWLSSLSIVGLLLAIALSVPSIREPLLSSSPVMTVASPPAPRHEQARLRHLPLQAEPADTPSAELERSEPTQVRPRPQQVIVDAPPVMDMPRDIPLGGGFGDPNGVVPDGTTVFDDGYPGVSKLNPALLAALREAADAAQADLLDFYVTSGWRSPEYQEQLLREAVIEYGSEEEAARWVATADTSSHVSGDAVDIGSYDAMAWLSQHGAKYGLCQIYLNEPWHYELRPEALDQGCPPMYPDPTFDPRMQR